MNSTYMDSSNSSNPYATPQTDLGHNKPSFSHHPLATRFKRLVAITIDMGILLLAELLALLAIDAIFGTNFFNEFWGDPEEDDTYLFETGLFSPLVYLSVASEMLIFFVINGYFLATRGQSLGKMALNIVIVDSKTNELSSFPNLFLFRYLPFWGTIVIMPIVYFAYALVDACFIFGSNRRTVHDRLARTVVLDLGKISSNVSDEPVDK